MIQIVRMSHPNTYPQFDFFEYCIYEIMNKLYSKLTKTFELG